MRLDILPAGSALPFGTAPYPHVVVHGTEAETALSHLRAERRGETPIVWGDAENAALLFELFAAPGNLAPITILQQTRKGSGVELLDLYRAEVDAHIAAFCKERGIEPPRDELDPDIDPEPTDPAGLLTLPWPPDVEPNTQLTGFLDLTSNAPKEQVLIGLLPTQNAHDAAAWHKFGGWNDCPPPAIHAALARDWHDQYGARLVVNTHDILEFEIARPIATKEEAVAMALLHNRYCSDIVDQGIGSVLRLAAYLLGARYWYFWWD